DEVDEREAEADRDAGEADGRALRRRPENHEEEEERQHDLGDGAWKERILTGRVRPVAVRRKPGAEREVGLARRDRVQRGGADEAAEDLRDDVRSHVARWKAPSDGEADRHRGIDVA